MISQLNQVFGELLIWNSVHLSSLNDSNPKGFWSKQYFYTTTHSRAKNSSVSKITCQKNVTAWVQISGTQMKTRYVPVGVRNSTILVGRWVGETGESPEAPGLWTTKKHLTWNKVEHKDWLPGLWCGLHMHHETDGGRERGGDREIPKAHDFGRENEWAGTFG